METKSREDPHRVIRDIACQPWAHDFFQGIRAIECAFRSQPRIGSSRTLRDDPVRFGQQVALDFASSTIARNETKAGLNQRILVRFMGLTGPNGALPLRLTEFIRNRSRGIPDPDVQGTAADVASEGGSVAPKDGTLAAFLDLFHHRSISFFYRAWAVSQKTVDYDREEDRSFAEWIGCLLGVGLPELDGVDSVRSAERLPFAGHLANQSRHTSGLEGLLSDAFSTETKVDSLVGQWIAIPIDQRCYLGRDRDLGSLGNSCVIGSQFWDRAMKFVVRLGPVSLEQFKSFWPNEQGNQKLRDWIAFYTRRELFWEAHIALERSEVPQIELGRSGRLGYSAWLSSLPFSDHPSDFHVRDVEVC